MLEAVGTNPKVMAQTLTSQYTQPVGGGAIA